PLCPRRIRKGLRAARNSVGRTYAVPTVTLLSLCRGPRCLGLRTSRSNTNFLGHHFGDRPNKAERAKKRHRGPATDRRPSFGQPGCPVDFHIGVPPRPI